MELALLEAGARGHPTVVLIHGYPDTKEMWKPVIAELADRFHVVAYDVRGAGGSGAPGKPHGYDLGQLGEDLIAVIDAVAPGKQVHLAGHDWGGIQGWEFATDRHLARRLRSFTAIAAPSLDQVALLAAERRHQPMRWLLFMRRSWYIAPLLIPGGPELMWRGLLGGGRWRWRLEHLEGVPVDDSYPAATLSRDAVTGANLYRRNILRRTARPRRDPVARVPVQLIIPTADRYIPLSYYERAEQYAPGLRRRTVAASHWLPRTDPGLVAESIASFVRGLEV